MPGRVGKNTDRESRGYPGKLTVRRLSLPAVPGVAEKPFCLSRSKELCSFVYQRRAVILLGGRECEGGRNLLQQSKKESGDSCGYGLNRKNNRQLFEIAKNSPAGAAAGQ